MQTAKPTRRKYPPIKMGEQITPAEFLLMRQAIQHAIQYWGGAYFVMFENGSAILMRKAPKDTQNLVAHYRKKVFAGSE
ncbi:MAG: hypothetical protein IPK27_19890 [Rhodanobacteraceae bacterium]|nr:hypothetical protein [Rhodanobacteraceae bacterium]